MMKLSRVWSTPLSEYVQEEVLAVFQVQFESNKEHELLRKSEQINQLRNAGAHNQGFAQFQYYYGSTNYIAYFM